MDLRNLISNDDSNSSPIEPPKPKKDLNGSMPAPPVKLSSTQPRLSIHDLMNDDDRTPVPAPTPATAPAPAPTLTPINTSATPVYTSSSIDSRRPSISNITNNNNTSNMSSPNTGRTPHHLSDVESKHRSSISHLTNDEDIDLEGNRTPSLAKIASSATLSESSSPKLSSKIPLAQLPQAISRAKRTSSGTLHDQIKALERLKEQELKGDQSGRPRRYKERPTWAKDYIPTVRKHHKKTGANGSVTTSTKLAIPSITGSIPRNDFNKVITEWVWANVEGVKQDYPDVPNVEEYVELELKAGQVWEKVKDRRLQLPINVETILSVEFFNSDCCFKSGVPVQQFHDIKGYLQKLSQDNVNQKSNNKFVVESSHMIDLIASEKKRNDRPISGRVSLDVKTKRKMASIQKQRVADLVLYLPNCLYDLRLSLSLELPYELNDAAYETFKTRVSMEREKERTSFIHQGTFNRIDLTKVKQNKQNKYELEIELNTPELLKSMKKVMDDPLYYIDLIQAFLDNGRIIARQLSVQY